MATISYKCNVCKREISKQENSYGVTVFGKCIITEGCLGQLYKLSRNIDNVRESFPFANSGLLDYTPRKAFFQHNQTILTNKWIIAHNLSTSPAVSVYVKQVDETLTQLNQDDFIITVINKDSIILTFTQPYEGIAQCISRSTTNITVPTVDSSSDVKITNNGIITIAIPELIINNPPSPNISMGSLPFNIGIGIKRPSEIEINSLENITSVLDTRSPWADWPRILIRKRKNYVIRTKSIFNLLALGTNAKPEDIPNGTQFRFTSISFPGSTLNIIESRMLLFLLSNPPYASVDKIKDKLLDVGELLDSSTPTFTYKNGELYIKSSVIENTYPDIMRIS